MVVVKGVICGILLALVLISLTLVPASIMSRYSCENRAEFNNLEWQWHFSTGCMTRLRPMATEKAR